MNHLNGSPFADTLRGNSSDNRIDGRGGDDVIRGDASTGGYLNDALTGGAGRDRFVFDRADQSTPDMFDIIEDFQGAGPTFGDRLDFAALVPGVLSFRGTAAFSGVNQVRVTDFGDETKVEVNLTGSKSPELVVDVFDGRATPDQWTAADFVL